MTSTASAGIAFDVADAIALLRRTPAALDQLLRGLPDRWLVANEGPGTWSPFDVIGHLIHGEKTDWMVRAQIILDGPPLSTFEPFDREAQFKESARPISDLLDEFALLRARNLDALEQRQLRPADLDKQGRHPALGVVTLRQLLATWVAHDHDHVVQISRVLAHQYAGQVGPWRAYLRVISGQPG